MEQFQNNVPRWKIVSRVHNIIKRLCESGEICVEGPNVRCHPETQRREHDPETLKSSPAHSLLKKDCGKVKNSLAT